MITVIEQIGAANWASYLINGDATGLSDREIALADAWQSWFAPAYVVSCEDNEPWFSWSYGLHTGDDCSGGDCLTYILHRQT